MFSEFPRAVREDKSQHTSMFYVSIFVTVAIVPLGDASHMAKTRVSVVGTAQRHVYREVNYSRHFSPMIYYGYHLQRMEQTSSIFVQESKISGVPGGSVG